ncbi:platelet glycoprotein V-like [Ambystoma mexicanum]|uniref:platelet glycoprotein V-like n=1 Tax=Ambystoma mexicanum TaxID=8296 RepID=UPI0037E91365
MFLLSLFSILFQLLQHVNGLYCPAQCDCTVKDSVRCLSPGITDIDSLGLPKNVTYVLIAGTSVSQLNDNCFRKMPVVLRLLLESNQIATVTPGAFRDLVELKTLRLTHNRLSLLPPGLFDALTRLEQLFLDQNSLTHVEQNIFNQLINLKELNLNKNRLNLLPERLFHNLVKLKTLNLSRNNLESLPLTIFTMLKSLEKLFLYENKLTVLQSKIFENLEELIELNFFSNKIEVIAPDVFNHLNKLEVLKFSKNKLQSLPSGLLLHLPNLTSLTLHENPFKELPDVLFGVMQRITKLWIYKTELSTVPNFVFSNLTNLNLLVLTLNPRLISLPSNVFSGLGALQELSLHTNNLTALDENLFNDLHNLRILALYSNNVRSLPGNLLRPLANLEKINLNDTKLENLPGDVFDSLPRLQEVQLQNNPWRCNCDIEDFKGWLLTNRNIVKDPMLLTCDRPLLLRNVPLLLTDRFLCPFSTSGPIFEYTSLETMFSSATDQPDFKTMPTSGHEQTTEVTTATTITVQETTIKGLNQLAMHTRINTASTNSVKSSHFILATKKFTSHTDTYQTVYLAETTHHTTETTSIGIENVSPSSPSYPGSTSLEKGGYIFYFKAPFSTLFFYLYLLSIAGQVIAIFIVIYVLYKINHWVHVHSFPLPVVLLNMSGHS